jgi:predicted RNA-binding protein (virulence factor B family)
MSITAGTYQNLAILSQNENTIVMEQNIPLVTDWPPHKLVPGQKITVFLYHNAKDVLCATTDTPKATLGDLVTLKVLSITPHGAYLDWGLPKDLFVPRSFHEDDLKEGDFCLVKLVTDAISGKVIGKERLEDELTNEVLSVNEKDPVDLVVYKNTKVGYQVIINGKHIGLLHYNEVFKELYAGDTVKGFIKKIKSDNKIDVVLGSPGHSRVKDEGGNIISLLRNNSGFLAYHDKSPAEDIYRVFGMSKKTFKMTLGDLYKRKKIVIESNGIRLVDGV